MAAWPSLHMEERNLLRQREWERRNQEAQQQQEQYQENAPLFGEPYKTYKGDELSSRIQRMLGNYEDMKDLHKNFGSVPSASVPFSRPGRPTHSDASKPPFQNPPLPYEGGSQVAPASHSASQPLKKSPAPDHTLLSSTYSQASVNQQKGSPEPLDRQSEPWPEMSSLPPVLSALSPPSGPLSPLHSSDPSDSEQHDTDGNDSPVPRQPLQAPSGPSGAVETSHAEAQMEVAPLANEAAPLPSQTFPLPLSSKPSLVMPQKPTAYVRPMDGQDQVASESPELKPSPDFDRHESLPDLKSSSKPGLTQLKIPPPSLEGLSSDAQCVEEILREMTHTWPPLLTAIHTPSTADPPKFNFPNKESQHGHSGYSVQKHEAWRGSSPAPPPVLSSQPEPQVAQARSSEGETASSSESESSSGSESDSDSSESGGEELEEAPPPHITSPPPPAKAEGPAVNEWQLGRWLELKEPQPSLSVETQGDALHSSPSSPASSPKAHEDTSPPQHYNSHNSPARPESASPAHYSYNSHSSLVQPETTTPPHYNYNSHSSPVRTEPSTPPHYNYTSHSSPVRSETTTPAHYNYTSHTSPSRPDVKDPESKTPVVNQHVRSLSSSPPRGVDSAPRKTFAKKKPSLSSKGPRAPQDSQRHADNKESASQQKDPSLTDRPKVKTKADLNKAPTKGIRQADKKAAKRAATDKKNSKEAAPKVTVKLSLPKEADSVPPGPQPPCSLKSRSGSSNRSDGLQKPSKKKKKQQQRERSPAQGVRPDVPTKVVPEPPRTLLVKIQLSLLSRVPSAPKGARLSAGGPTEAGDKRAERGDAVPAKASKKRSAEKEDKSQPRKKLKLDKDIKRSSSPIPNPSSSSSSSTAPSCPGSSKSEAPKGAAEGKEKERKKKKAPSSSTQALAAQEPPKGPGHKRPLPDASESKASSSHTGEATVKHKKSSSKRSEHTKTGKKSPKSSFAVPEPAQPKRAPLPQSALLKVDDRQYSVEHHMKEAKKLKHKADAMSEKVGKSLLYLEAALSFVESGIAMESDPQTPKSAYTMFSETVDLIRFILKLRSYSDPASPASEKDFAILCMRFQSLLQMAMFRNKREAALKYSRTLTDHFKSCKTSPSPRVSKTTSTPSQLSPMASPASSSSSGPGSSHSSGAAPPANTVALPQAIHQVASTYVSITALFLSAHSIWEQAEEMTPKGSGVLGDLDSAIGPLTLLSSMSTVVRYIRQGLHLLRQDSQHTH